jgi:hypothetical protein
LRDSTSQSHYRGLKFKVIGVFKPEGVKHIKLLSKQVDTVFETIFLFDHSGEKSISNYRVRFRVAKPMQEQFLVKGVY